MKANIKSIFFTACTAALLSGCTDLDVAVESQYTEYPNNEVAIEAKLSDIYFQMRDCFGRRYMEAMCLSSDEFTGVAYGNNWYDEGAYAHPSLHNFKDNDATIDWMYILTSGCTKVNDAIVEMGGEEADPGVIAPARAMRAYFHFIMMDCWGDAPIMDHKLAEGETVNRSPRADVAKFIEKELLDIKDLLTEEVNSNTYGKPTRWMAEALLAKLYINWPVYTAKSVDLYDANNYQNDKLDDCIALCDDIIKSGMFTLGQPYTYQQKFGPDNGVHIKDFIYVMPYDTYDAQGMQYGRAFTWKKAKDVDKSYYGMKLSNSGGGYITMTPEFGLLFEDEEAGDRAKSVLMGPVFVYDPKTYEPTNEPAYDTDGTTQINLKREITLVSPGDITLNIGETDESYNMGYRPVKFFVIDDDYKNNRNQSNDLPIFRYADILLTKAEAILRGGTPTEGDTPYSLLKQVRDYVNAPTTETSPTLDDLYKERGREFYCENWRRNDMIRFGHFEDEYFPHYKTFPTARFDKRCRIFPIHYTELNRNPTWVQNPGYAANDNQ